MKQSEPRVAPSCSVDPNESASNIRQPGVVDHRFATTPSGLQGGAQILHSDLAEPSRREPYI